MNSSTVEIRVNLPVRNDSRLSDALVSTFGLRDARVLGPEDESWRAQGLAVLALHQVAGLLTDGGLLGVGWGQTMDDLLSASNHLQLTFPRADVVQLTGGVPSPTGGVDSTDVVHRFGLLTGGNSTVLNAPLIVPDAEVAVGLRRAQSVATVLEMGRSSDVALFGVGFWRGGRSPVWAPLSPAEKQSVLESGVFANVFGIMLDENGSEVVSPVSDRLIGIDGPSLRRIPRRVCLVMDIQRSAPLMAVLRSGLITDLIVDASVAEDLLSRIGSTA